MAGAEEDAAMARLVEVEDEAEVTKRVAKPPRRSQVFALHSQLTCSIVVPRGQQIR